MAKKEECVYCKFLKKSSYGQLRCAFFACKPQFDGIECRRFCKIADDDNPPSFINPNEEEVVKHEIKQENPTDEQRYEYSEEETSNNKKYFWPIVIVVFLLVNAISADRGLVPSSAFRGKASIINLFRLGEDFVYVLQTILDAIIPFVLALVYFRMKELTKSYNSHFQSKFYALFLKKKNSIEGLFVCQLLYAIISVLFEIPEMLFGSDWDDYLYIDPYLCIGLWIVCIAVGIIVIIKQFTVGKNMIDINISSLGKYMVAYGIVGLVFILFTIIAIIYDNNRYLDSYFINMMETIVDLAFIYIYFKLEEQKLKNTLSKLEPDND